LSKRLAIKPIGPFNRRIRPPGSKSLTNRALLLAALAQGESVLQGALLADDTQRLFVALDNLGFSITSDKAYRLVKISGLGGRLPGIHNQEIKLNLGNAGTAYRFLTAACCLATDPLPQGHSGEMNPSTYRLDGIDRMHQRPIGQLVDCLRQLGGQIQYLGKDGFPPLEIVSSSLTGGVMKLSPTLSSQYISALLQVGPYCDQGLTIQFEGPVTSRPYVEMTMALMKHFGADVESDSNLTSIRVGTRPYQGTDYAIEPDASNASYFLAAAAIIPGSQCTIDGLGKRSCQGDIGFADVLHQMGAGLLYGSDFITVMAPPKGEFLRGIDIDLNAMPDMAQTLAMVALFAEGHTTIRNIGNLRYKETDRIEALRCELTKVGAKIQVDGDNITIRPPASSTAAMPTETIIDTYDDHRMAMSFALIGLARPGIVINDPECVNKTFPDYFEYLSLLDSSS